MRSFEVNADARKAARQRRKEELTDVARLQGRSLEGDIARDIESQAATQDPERLQALREAVLAAESPEETVVRPKMETPLDELHTYQRENQQAAAGDFLEKQGPIVRPDEDVVIAPKETRRTPRVTASVASVKTPRTRKSAQEAPVSSAAMEQLAEAQMAAEMKRLESTKTERAQEVAALVAARKARDEEYKARIARVAALREQIAAGQQAASQEKKKAAS